MFDNEEEIATQRIAEKSHPARIEELQNHFFGFNEMWYFEVAIKKPLPEPFPQGGPDSGDRIWRILWEGLSYLNKLTWNLKFLHFQVL